MSDLVKYQKLILDVMLLQHYPFSYELINESKSAQLELIHKRRKEEITADIYKQHHFVHFTRQKFLEAEIDRVRQEVTEAYITGLGSKNNLAKNLALAEEVITKSTFKIYTYDIIHYGLQKPKIDYKRFSDREEKLQDYLIQAQIYAKELFEEAPIKSLFSSKIPDRTLMAICSNYLLVTSTTGYIVPIIQKEKVESLIANHNAKISRGDIPAGTHVNEAFMEYIYEKKEEYLAGLNATKAAAEREIKQMANNKSKGTK